MPNSVPSSSEIVDDGGTEHDVMAALRCIFVMAGACSQEIPCVSNRDSRTPIEVEQCLMSPRSEVRVLMEMWT